ncbi:MAG: hypothetical protein GY694_00195 [Gammaproteobacteria bacterium]|nr:hypothetical protein [Gammaproteobacteria bacterium]
MRWSKFDYKARMKSALERHIESVHEKQFNYSLCDFKTVNDHEGIKPLWCSDCDYKARMKSAIERHIESVHEKQFNYSLCDFKTVTDHEGIKPL